MDLTEFDLRVASLRDRAGPLAERLRSAAASLRQDAFAPSLELEPAVHAYMTAYGDLQSRLGRQPASPRTFADLEDARRPLASLHEARQILKAVEDLQSAGPGSAAGQSDTAAIRERIAGVRSKLAGPDRDELARLIVEGRHPVNDLWTLVLAAEPLDDERWDSLVQSVEQFFGRGVATAAIRGRLRRGDPA